MGGNPSDVSTNGRPLPKQRRAIQTRQKLIQQGLRAFSGLGHDRVNLAHDILEPAGVSVGSFYHQFTDKTDLMVTVFEEVAHRRRTELMSGLVQIAERDGLTLTTAFEEVLLLYFASLRNEEHGWRMFLNERNSEDPRVQAVIYAGRPRWLDGISMFLQRWVDSTEADLQRAARMVTVMASGLNLTEVPMDEDPGREAALAHDAAAFISGGVAALVADGAAR